MKLFVGLLGILLPVAVLSQDCPLLATLRASANTQYLTSHSYPSLYPNDLQCSWTIDAPTTMAVLVVVLDADIELNFDNLQLSDESNTVKTVTGLVENEIPFITSTYKLIVRFNSDSSVRHKGFRVSYKAVPKAGVKFTAQGASSPLTSPNYPAPYDNNEDCYWEIAVAGASHVELTIHEGATQSVGDYITVLEGNRQLAQLSGNFAAPASFTSVGQTLSIYFHTDDAGTGRGFRATYKQATCGDEIDVTGADVRTLTTPGYPISSSNNLDCNYVLRPEPGKRIQVVITADTEECCDYVDVLEGTRVVTRVRGNVTNVKHIAGLGSTITLRYVTDGSVISKGVSVEYRQLDPPKPINYNVASSGGYCQAAGDPHFVSFDGKAFDFQGVCSYEFVKYVKNGAGDAPSFLIEVYQEPIIGTTVAVIEQVKITIGNTVIELLKGLVVHVNGVKVKLPHKDTVSGTNVMSSGGYAITIGTSFGLFIKHQTYYLKVSLSKDFKDKVTGLCGNYNDDRNDDFPLNRNINGINFLEPVYAIDLKTNSKPCNVPPPNPDEVVDGCTREEKVQFEEKCRVLSDAGNDCFRDCHGLVSPQTYYQECVFDACTTGNVYQAVTDSFSAYEVKCLEADAPIQNWRVCIGRANPTCPEGSYFNVNAPLCLPTCVDPQPDPNCVGQNPGCVCSEGFLWSDTRCVHASDCGCTVEPHYYEQGETYLEEGCTRQWTCHNGMMQPKAHQCPPNTKCKTEVGKDKCAAIGKKKAAIKGNPHFTTFDGVFYDFDGTGTFLLSRTESESPESDRWISIEGEISYEDPANRRHLSLSAVVVKMMNGTQEIRMEDDNQLMLNGEKIRGHDSDLYKLRPSGRSVVLTTKYEVEVEFGLAGQLSLTLPSSYYNQVQGMFGNSNGRVNDDVTDESGEELTDYNEFARRFQMSEEATYPPPSPSCSSADRLRWQHAANCGMLTQVDGVFAGCHDVVPVANYFSTCVEDVCSTNGDRSVLERAVEVYAGDCARAEVQLCDWRQRTGFENIACPENSHYQGCTSACTDTCLHQFATANCDLSGNTESCVCNSGFVKDGDKCIRSSDCAAPNANGTYVVREDSFLAFVLDVSGSMTIELEAIKSWLSSCIEGSCGDSPTGGWVISPFSDPATGPLFGPATNLTAAASFVAALRAEGGGDSDEMGFTGIARALNVIPLDNSGCHVYYASDSPPKDTNLISTVRSRLQDTRCQFSLILTGYFPLDSLPDDAQGSALSALRELSLTSGGRILISGKPNSVEWFSNYLENNIAIGVNSEETVQ